MTSILANPSAPAKTVTDNAKYAWDNSSQYCLAGLADDFVSEYRDLIDAAAITAIEPELRTEWARRGYTVEFGPWDNLRSSEVERPLDDVDYWLVWDQAADRLDGYALVAAAGLNEQLHGWLEND